jgi:dephospho-CoA kinase
MKKIAITGTIGSGKTECSRIIKKLGYTVFNCDEEVNNIYMSNHPDLINLIDVFPDAYNDGIWDKKVIAKIVFNDAFKKKQLEAIIYPILLNKMQEAMKMNGAYFFAEVPLLFQIGWEQYFDEILVITCDDEVAIKRLVDYRHMDLNDAKLRLQNQRTISNKIESNVKFIYNNKDVIDLEKQVIDWLEKEIINDGTKS